MGQTLIYLSPNYINYPNTNLVQSLSQFDHLSRNFSEAYFLSITSLNQKRLNQLIIDCSSLCEAPNGITKLSRLASFLLNTYLLSIFQLSQVFYILCKKSFKKEKVKIYSRNLLSSFLLTCLGFKNIFEFHSYQSKYIFNLMQRKIINSKVTGKVFISESLKNIFTKKISKENFYNFVVLHVSSSEYYNLEINNKNSNSYLPNCLFNKSKINCIYICTTQDKNGIKLIIKIASKLPNINFILIGKIKSQLKNQIPNNIYITGYLSHQMTIIAIKHSDIALYPTQSKSLLSNSGVNVTKYMSPLKLFDYMQSKTPIISSYLKC